MNKLMRLLGHMTFILSAMFLTFLILDQFNPMMNFIDNGISRVLLALLCVTGIARTVAGWIREE